MKRRPPIVIFLGVLHLLEPLSKIFYLQISLGFSFQTVLNNVLAIDHPMSVFEFWFLFPLAGICLLLVKKWSYILFFILQSYALFIHMTYERFTWPWVSDRPIFSSLFLLIINIILILYFLFSKVREPFLHKRLRWWETKERFDLPLNLQIIKEGEELKGKMMNISLSGLLATIEGQVKIGDKVELKFTLLKLTLFLEAEVMNKREINSEIAYGMQFLYRSLAEHLTMRRLVKALRLLRA